jgi:hypothetical protein
VVGVGAHHLDRQVDYSFNATLKALFPVIDTLTEADTSMAYFGIAPPTLSFGTSADSFLYLLVVPKSAETIDLVYGTLFPKKYTSSRRFQETQALSSTGLTELMKQDVAATMSVQRGLKSRFAPRGRFSWQEFVREGSLVMLIGRTLASLDASAAAVRASGGEATVHVCDVSSAIATAAGCVTVYGA